MPKSRKRAKVKRPPTPREAFAALMVMYRSQRPLATIAPCLQNALAAYAETGELQGDRLKHFAMNATLMGEVIVHGWEVDPPWEDEDTGLFISYLQDQYQHLTAQATPPPAFPTGFRQGDSPAALWQHLDYLNFRAIACLGEPTFLKASLEDTPLLQTQIQGMRYLREFERFQMQVKPEHAFDTAGLLGEFGTLLAAGHAWIDEVAATPRTEWPTPSFDLAAPIHATLEEAREVLASLPIQRPFHSALGWSQLMATIFKSAEPGWRWLPALDGRETAVALFDQSIWAPSPPWKAAETARFSALATALYQAGVQQVQPTPSALEDLDRIDPESPAPPELLWEHADRLHAAFTALLRHGLVTLETRGVPKEGRRLANGFMDLFGMLMGFIANWQATSVENRTALQGALVPLLALQYQQMHPLLQGLDPEVLALLPPDLDLTPNRRARIDAWMRDQLG